MEFSLTGFLALAFAGARDGRGRKHFSHASRVFGLPSICDLVRRAILPSEEGPGGLRLGVMIRRPVQPEESPGTCTMNGFRRDGVDGLLLADILCSL